MIRRCRNYLANALALVGRQSSAVAVPEFKLEQKPDLVRDSASVALAFGSKQASASPMLSAESAQQLRRLRRVVGLP